MNKKYKLVEVGFSNCGNDILGVEIVEGESKEVVIKERFEKIDKVDLEENFGENWEEWIFICDDKISICMGEENGIYCIDEDEDESMFLED